MNCSKCNEEFTNEFLLEIHRIKIHIPPSQKILLEIHGKQHYEPTNFRNNKEKFIEVVERDQIKLEYANDNNYHYIVIDTRKNFMNQLSRFHRIREI